MEIADSVETSKDCEKNKLNVIEFYHKILWDSQQLEPLPSKHGRRVGFSTDPPTIHEYESECSGDLAFSYYSSSQITELCYKEGIQPKMTTAHESDTQNDNNQRRRKRSRSKFVPISNMQSNSQPQGFSMDPMKPDISNSLDVFSNDLFKDLQVPETLLNAFLEGFIYERKSNDCAEMSGYTHSDNTHTDKRNRGSEKKEHIERIHTHVEQKRIIGNNYGRKASCVPLAFHRVMRKLSLFGSLFRKKKPCRPFLERKPL